MEELVQERQPKRLPKFERAGEDALPFRIEERDLLGWRWIYACRFLPSEYPLLLLPGSHQQILRRAQRWYHGAYVDRIRTGVTSFLYAIANKGADEVCARYGFERGRIDWSKKNKELKDAYFRAHTLSTAKLRVTLEMGVRHKAMGEANEAFAHWPVAMQASALETALAALKRQNRGATWGPGVFNEKARTIVLQHVVSGMLAEIHLAELAAQISPIIPTVGVEMNDPAVPLSYLDDKGKWRTIVPDWPFMLINGDFEAELFVETDRSTMTDRDFIRKLRAYWLYWKQEDYKATQGLPARNMFRVLTTCKSWERCENLRRLARAVDDRHTGSELFWFTCEEAYDPHIPDSIWTATWRTPKNEEWHMLLDE